MPIERNKRNDPRFVAPNKHALGHKDWQWQGDIGAADIAVASGDELADRTIAIAARRLVLRRGFRIGEPEERLLLRVDADVKVGGSDLRLGEEGEQQDENENASGVQPGR